MLDNLRQAPSPGQTRELPPEVGVDLAAEVIKKALLP